MKRCAMLTTITAAVAVTACGKSDKPAGEATKTPQDVASAVAQVVKPNPGLYRSTMKVLKFEIPGMPAAQAERMKGMFSAAGVSKEFCVTPQMAENGYRDYAKNLGQGNCTVDSFDASGGNITSKMTCQTSRGGTAVMEMQGTVAPDSSTMHMKMEQQLPPGVPAGMGAVKMEMEVASQRLGECKS